MLAAKFWIRALCAAVLVLGIASRAQAETTSSVTYRGSLIDHDSPAADGKYDLRFQLYKAIDGGDSLASLDASVDVHEGAFAAEVGSLFTQVTGDVYLSISVQAPGTDSYDVLSRVDVLAVPFA